VVNIGVLKCMCSFTLNINLNFNVNVIQLSDNEGKVLRISDYNVSFYHTRLNHILCTQPLMMAPYSRNAFGKVK
jgi:hypothetical protein